MLECTERKGSVANGTFSQPAEYIRRIGEQWVTNHRGVMSKEWEERFQIWLQSSGGRHGRCAAGENKILVTIAI